MASAVPGWAIELGEVTSPKSADITVGPDDHVYVTGNFDGTFDFDPGSGIANLTATPGGTEGDGFVAKYTPDQQLVWARRLGGNDNERVKAIDVDSSGNVYVGGEFASTSADFGGFTLGTTGGRDAYFAKLDSHGNFLWVRHVGSATDDVLETLDVSDDGNAIVIGGHFSETVDFDPGTGQSIATSEGSTDGYVAVFDSGGEFQWVWTHGGPGSDGQAKAMFGPDGSIYAHSKFRQTNDLGQGIVLTSANDWDQFIAEFDSAGTIQWGHQLSSPKSFWGGQLSVDGSGSLLFTSLFDDRVDLGSGGLLVGSNDGSQNDFFVMRMDADRNVDWVKQFSSSGEMFQPRKIELDSSGTLLIPGLFSGTADLDPGPGVLAFTADWDDGFALGLDATTGDMVWAHHFPGVRNNHIQAISMDSQGRAYVNGVYAETLESPTGENLVGNLPKTTRFMARLDVNSTVELRDTFENGAWNGAWSQDGQEDWYISAQQATDGNYSAEVNGRADDATLSVASPVDLSGYSEVELRFDWRISAGLDGGEYVKLDFWDGSSWNEIRSLDGNIDSEDVWHNEIVQIESLYHRSDFRFRYRATANKPTEVANIDNVALFGIGTLSDPPLAQDDAWSLDEDTVLPVASPGVLGNDSDPEGDSLTAVLENGPNHGSLTLNPDGSFTYTPDADFSGNDSFTYMAHDGANQTPAVVSLTVNPINDPPVGLSDNYTVESGQTLIAASPGVLANDIDPENAALIAELVQGPSQGSLSLNADGSFSYTPNPGAVGVDSFSYRASDGQAYSDPIDVEIDILESGGGPIAFYISNLDVVPRPRGRNKMDYQVIVQVMQDVGTVGDAGDDTPLFGASVTVFVQGVGLLDGVTNESGVFESVRLRHLAPGDYLAEVTDVAFGDPDEYSWNQLFGGGYTNDEDGDGLPDYLFTVQ